MIQPRVYTVSFAASAQAGAIDFFELITGASGGLVLLGLDIGQTTELGDAAEEQIDWYIKRGTGTYTSGSGGNTGVARPPVVPGDSAATFTAESLNTTRIAVGTGTLTTIFGSTFNLRSGLQMFWTPETAPRSAVSTALAIGMTGAPADSVTWVGTAYVGELSP
jgi:hypothetical protein